MSARIEKLRERAEICQLQGPVGSWLCSLFALECSASEAMECVRFCRTWGNGAICVRKQLVYPRWDAHLRIHETFASSPSENDLWSSWKGNFSAMIAAR